MVTRRLMACAMAGTGAAVVLTVALAASPQGGKPTPDHAATMKRSTMTTAQKITNAMTAAPSTISGKATVLDWPEKEGAAPPVLRPGTNGWTCLPDMPESQGNDPMCLDETWMKWTEAYLSHTTPNITRIGIGYMLAPGGGWGSNSDPFAMKETPDNHWGHHMPHMMILVPDPKALTGVSSDPANGGPYVMFAGTPYAHIMAPTTATSTTSRH